MGMKRPIRSGGRRLNGAYRGYPIDQLDEQSNFVETCYLLFFGQFPTREQYQKFRRPDSFDEIRQSHLVMHVLGLPALDELLSP